MYGVAAVHFAFHIFCIKMGVQFIFKIFTDCTSKLKKSSIKLWHVTQVQKLRSQEFLVSLF